MNSGTGIYKSGVLAFFAGAILIGALLGAVTFCFMGSDELSMLSVFSNSFVDVRSSGDLEEILVRSFFSSTVFLAVVFLSGFSSLGQPLAVAVLLLRVLQCLSFTAFTADMVPYFQRCLYFFLRS